MMKKAIDYINKTLCINVIENQIQNNDLSNLPIYISKAYKFYNVTIFNKDIVLVELKNEEDLSILQLDKHLQLIKNTVNKIVVLVLTNIFPYNRKRLIEKGINFIVPEKQLFMPELLINLSENYTQRKTRLKNLMPSSQLLFLFHIIHRNNNWKVEEHSFKEIAKKLNYTPMAVSYAVDDLKNHGLIEVIGEKEKYIKFNLDRSALWHVAQEQNLLGSPVLKTVYVDELPQNVFMLKANASALPAYTDLNPSQQPYFAIEKTVFYGLQKNNTLRNPNENEGKYALEIWKYNPITLVNELHNDIAVVDPLSLYLSLKDSHDERIEMALDQIAEKYVW